MSVATVIEESSVLEILRASGLRHLAIIMDGNRRWARNQSLPPIAGHEQGVEALRRTVRYANRVGLPILTVYAFSTENWQRPPVEVDGLMDLFVESLEKLVPEFHEQGVRVSFFGDLTRLSALLQQRIRDAVELTQHNPGMLAQVAMNYGARQELLRACVALIEEYQANGHSPQSLTEEAIAARLCNPRSPDPDVILRTGGEHRLSNFLLWQAAYSEVMVNDVLWPDFSLHHFNQAILDFANRKRRFGR